MKKIIYILCSTLLLFSCKENNAISKDIDKVLPKNSVYLQHTSGHMGIANSLELEK